ncbi:cell division protein ZapA [Aureimonas ureilytica]|uniref:Cell division protein ZapA n=1 Tax=Aureimonas ureilytica TaxID=401562 RepID=A0A175R6G9_9HYPH|nr:MULTISPECIES: cell division protein ZapA [Aureimonas]KTQ94054.1 cell division protein ZapA [Aureimonas ureilytica]KTR05061.1 cell division protein ZapA [Aureimonas ureilytica]
MPQIVVTIDGKTYRMACAEGEEAHLTSLAADIDARINELRGSFGEIGELRLSVMAAIMVNDELSEQRRRVAELEAEVARLHVAEEQAALRAAATGDQRLVEHLLGVSEIVERIAERLETGR